MLEKPDVTNVIKGAKLNDIIQEYQVATVEYMRLLSCGQHHRAMDMSFTITHLQRQLNMNSAMMHLHSIKPAIIAPSSPKTFFDLEAEEHARDRLEEKQGKVG